MTRRYLSAALFVTLFFSNSVLAQSSNFKCNQPQTICEFEDKQLLMGDQVLIMDDADQIVATAEVVGMTEKKRRVKVNQRYTTIYASHKMMPLYDQTLEEALKKYKTAIGEKQQIGGNLGFLRLNLDTDSVAYNFQFHFDHPWRQNMAFHLRGSFFTLSGETSDGFGEQEGESYSLSGFALGGGLSYTLFSAQTVSFKPSGGFALFYAMPSDEELTPLKRVKSGANFGYFASVHARMRMSNRSFLPYAFAEFVGIGSDATGVGVGIGFEMALENRLF